MRIAKDFRIVRVAFVTLSLGMFALSQTLAADVEHVFKPDELALVPVQGLTTPEPPESRNRSFSRLDRLEPYGVLDGPGEVYVILDDKETGPKNWRVALRLPAESRIKGRLFIPQADAVRYDVFQFDLPAQPAKSDVHKLFETVKGQAYQRLVNLGVPGSAWFRHQAVLSGVAQVDGGIGPNAPRLADFGRTFEFFSGTRAVRENMQLDRALPPITPGEATVDVSRLAGISVAAIDWRSRLASSRPKVDPLARFLPSDQHVLLIPSLAGLESLLQELRTVPTGANASMRAEEEHVVSRYERQLGLNARELAASPLSSTVRQIALTGSDPFFSAGTDLALLFDTSNVEGFKAFLRGRQAEVARSRPELKQESGTFDTIEYHGIRSADGSIRSYVASYQDVVILSNSAAQLNLVLMAARNRTQPLSALEEYDFFRTRYPIGQEDETGFVVITDATIRRWCGPLWRIGASRRLRAGGVLSDLQASLIPNLLGRTKTLPALKAPDNAPEMGGLEASKDRVESSKFGNIDFMTPIAELDLRSVTPAEADAYGRWRDGYQSNWRRYFDPIAVRLLFRPDRIKADLTVMPLILGTSYREAIEVAGKSTLQPTDGDPHPETIFQTAIAIDPSGPSMQRVLESIKRMDRPDKAEHLTIDWLGNAASFYVDDGPFWQELAKSPSPNKFIEENFEKAPAAVFLAVKNREKLLPVLRRIKEFVEKEINGILIWSESDYHGVKTARISSNPKAGGFLPRSMSLHAAVTETGLTITLNESMLHRAIDRSKKPINPETQAWAGKSVALRLHRTTLGLVAGAMRAEAQRFAQEQSWSNLPILNEWHRLSPEQDPVAVHKRLWGTDLVCPGGGTYVWNASHGTMESSIYGSPGFPKDGPDPLARIQAVREINLGVDFEADGLRGRVDIQRVAKPR